MIQVEGIFTGVGSDISAPIIGKDFNWSGGDNTYQVLEDGNGNWRIKFLSSGIFTPLRDMIIDAFLVAGGGSGSASTLKTTGAGGGSGHTKTVKSIVLAANTAYSIVIGAGGAEVSSGAGNAGGDTSAFSETVAGGEGGTNNGIGGKGGSGGGAYDSANKIGSSGGSDGSDGSGSTKNPGGTGQGTTTREFGESDGDLYAGGGGGYYSGSSGAGGADGGGNAKESGVANTGSGGGACGGAGASGIVVIRKHKAA